MVDPRMPPGVLTPTRNVTAFSAFRVGVGITAICSTLRVAVTAGVTVLISSEPAPLTVIVSDTSPSSSAAFSVVGIAS